MKLPGSLLSIATALWLFPTASYAADCTKANDVFPWGQDAVEMMWQLRAIGCGQHWWENWSLTGHICSNNYAPCWEGSWYFHNHPSQQSCWNVLEQIINQCMYAKWLPNGGTETRNGGTWSWGAEYSQGWFWNVPSGKRDLHSDEQNYNVTLLHTGEVVTPERVVHLDFDANGTVTRVAGHFVHQKDGTFKKEKSFKLPEAGDLA
ncbi:hypothetical protein BGZ63DRAFT_425110 [Mariannaea sp. PMI_226]|nr:hypothetical protein BGZ63DRAFT_425110 [Mariannaea sp. PMI_226]